GEWKSNNDEIPVFKWCSRSGCKWAAIPLDGEICSVGYIRSEMYKIMGLVGTERLRISYVPDVRHWHIRPIYIENDNDLRAYLYFDCPKDMHVLHVEVEPCIIYEEVGMESRALDIFVGSAELGDAILTETVGGGNVTDYCYDEYFDRNIVSTEEVSVSEYALMNNVTEQENDVEEDIGVGVVHLEDVEHIVTQPDEFNVRPSGDTFSFTDGSNLYVGQEFQRGFCV
ncbi:hypothetical protein F511_36630, partial [Dorcoceras hygrometricum]